MKQPHQQHENPGHGDVVKARERIQALNRVLGAFDSCLALLESGRPAKDLLNDENVADLISRRLLQATSGKGHDQACQWLFDTYQTQDPELQLVVLRFIPILCGVYLCRLTTCTDEPLAALEPQSLVKSTKRAVIVGVALELFCKRLVVMPPKAKLDLCHYARSWAVKGCGWSNEVGTIAKTALSPPPSLNRLESWGEFVSSSSGIAMTIGQVLTVEHEPLHSPLLRRSTEPGKMLTWDTSEPSVSASLESRERAREPAWEEEDGDDDDSAAGPRVSLDMEVLRPVLKALGHCLMAPSSGTPALKAAALEAASALYARASQALLPEAVLASRSLVRLGAAASSLSPSPGSAEGAQSRGTGQASTSTRTEGSMLYKRPYRRGREGMTLLFHGFPQSLRS